MRERPATQQRMREGRHPQTLGSDGAPVDTRYASGTRSAVFRTWARALQQPHRAGPTYGLGARTGAELHENALVVRFHCLGRNLEVAGDPFVGRSLAYHDKDIPLTDGDCIAHA